MKKLASLAIISVMLCAAPARASEVDYDAINAAGFADVGDLLKSMTPEQQKEVLRQAALKQKELEKRTPEQLE